jgi:MFS family permease
MPQRASAGAMWQMRPAMHRPWPARIAVTAVFYANGLGYGAFAGNIPRLQEAAHLSPARLGLALLAASLGSVLTMPLDGPLAGRIGSARVASVAGVVAGLALVLPALAVQAKMGFPALLATMAVFGTGVGVMDVAMNARGSELERAWGGAIMSSLHGGWSVGGLTGAALAAAFAAAGAPIALALGSCGAVIVVSCLAALRVRGPSGPTHMGPAFAWPSRSMAGLCAITTLCFTMEGAMANWTGVYLRGALHASEALATGAYSGYALAMTCGRLGGDSLVRRFGPAWALRAGAVLAGCGIASGLASTDPLTAAGCFALVGLGLANVVPVTFSAAGRREAAAGIAMTATTGYCGLMAGPPLLGFLAQAAGLGAALLFVLVGAAALVALAGAVR